MSHTHESSALAPSPPLGSSWVRCRARTWKVLDVHHTATASVWKLARGAELARTFASPPDEMQAQPPRGRRVSSRAWLHAARDHLRARVPVWWPAQAALLPIAPVPYQQVPAMAALSGHHRRVLLADDVGMGKTVQAGIVLHEIHAREPDAATLVVVPAALVAQWARELRTRVRVDAVVLDAVALRREALQPHAMVDASRGGACWLISLDLLRQPEVAALLARTSWTLLVVDEAHLAAPGTARLAAVSRVATASVRLLLLTATPHASGSAGADSLRTLGARHGERPMAVIRRRGALLARPPRRTRVLRVSLDAGHLALCVRLDRFVDRARRDRGAAGLLPALVLRRRASSCPAAVVRSLERRLQVLGSAPAASVSPPLLFDDDEGDAADQDARDDELMREQAWNDEAAERVELERLLTLARRLPPAGRKLLAVVRFLRRCREPVVVFTAFVDVIRALRPCVQGRCVAIVHGRQPDALRVQAIEAFTSGAADVLLTTDASAEGLNLHTRCRLVVHAELPVSSRSFLQRTGRVDRYGQARRVHAVVLASDTTEDRDALTRLRLRGDDAEAWMAGVASERCRRTEVAARQMAALAPSPQGRRGDRRRHEIDAARPSIVTCRLRQRQWHRVRGRLGLPADTARVWLGALRAGGSPMLTTWAVPVAVASRVGAPPSAADVESWPAVVWRASLPIVVARAGRLVRRLGSWERAADAARARLASEHAAAPGLFDDAAVTRSAVYDPGPERDDGVHVTMEVSGRLECRG